MADLVVVDFRNLCKICSFSMLSGQIACQYATEPDEIAHRLAKRLFCIRAEHPDASIVFALDTPPYWRHSYIVNWYNVRGIEPVGYKANRADQSWPFATDRITMDTLYVAVRYKMATALEALVIGDTGLEADDIWGLTVTSTPKTVTIQGISTDSDWQQLCGGNVTVLNPVTNEIMTRKLDMRTKYIAGDRGDNIMGIPKRKANGDIGTKMWGKDGAAKLVATHTPEELEVLFDRDKDVYKRNYALITLPCPSWDLAEASKALEACVRAPIDGDAEAILNGYGITAPVRKLLLDKAERNAWISKLRAHLQEQNRKPKAIVEDSQVNRDIDADVDLAKAFP